MRGGRPTVYHWPPEREGELVRRFKAGERVKAIARDFGLPPHAVDTRIDKLRREGRLMLRNRPWLPQDDRAVLQGIAAGDKPRVIASAIRRTPNAVRVRIVTLRKRQRQALAAAALPFAAPPPSPALPIPDRDQFTLELRAA